MSNMLDEDDVLAAKFGDAGLVGSKGAEGLGGEESDDEENDEVIQDWGNFLQSANLSIPVVPKVGDKGFEPTSNNYDNLLLQNKRDIMYATIGNSVRGHVHKNHVEAFWFDEQDNNEGPEEHNADTNHLRALITKPKGSVFNNIGIRTSKNHVYLHFEEILYMVERGNVECWMVGSQKWLDSGRVTGSKEQVMPLSLQACYAMFLKTNMDYDMFYVYSYLKRYGYSVRRATQDFEYSSQSSNRMSVFNVILGFFKDPISKFINFLRHLRWFILLLQFSKKAVYLKDRFNWATYYKSLNFIPYGDVLDSEKSKGDQTDKFQIVYNIWKPNNQLRVESLKQPDFQLIIVNTNLTKLPTVADVKTIFSKCYRTDRVLLAIIDNGILNFVKLTSSSIGSRNIYLENQKKARKKQLQGVKKGKKSQKRFNK